MITLSLYTDLSKDPTLPPSHRQPLCAAQHLANMHRANKHTELLQLGPITAAAAGEQ